MKAIVNEKYGSPDLLQLQEVDRPEPKDDEVLIRVLAASVNKADWQVLQGRPFPVRLMAGLFNPKFKILGADIAGIVERVGKKISQFKPGDEVFGDLSGSGFGGFAEFAITDEKRLAKKPSNFSYEKSAALPMAAITALQGLRDKGKVGEGQKVLINGASGGVGGYAVQIAKTFGAMVTAVCSEKKRDLALRLGADEVIIYTQTDFTQQARKYDLVFDVIGNHSIRSIDKVLKKGGRYVSCAFSLGALFLGPWKSLTENKKMINFISNTNQADLQFISKLSEEGKIDPVLQQSFTLDDVPEALRIMGKGGMSGKLVITI